MVAVYHVGVLHDVIIWKWQKSSKGSVLYVLDAGTAHVPAVTRMALRLWSDQEGLALHLLDVEAMARTTSVHPVKS